MPSTVSAPVLTLVRATAANKVFEALFRQWTDEAAGYGDDQYAFAQLDHARRIAGEPFSDPNYGIFSLTGDDRHHGLAHFNRAMLPGTIGHTLRVLWVLLAPRYDYEDMSDEDAARLIGGFVHASICLCASGEMKANHLKIHLQNRADRRLAAGLAQHLDQPGSPTSVAVRGNWLHIDNVSSAS